MKTIAALLVGVTVGCIVHAASIQLGCEITIGGSLVAGIMSAMGVMRLNLQ